MRKCMRAIIAGIIRHILRQDRRDKMKSQFIFSRSNRWLKKYYELWKKKEAFGSYILIGASGSGKSLFLKQLVDELGVEYYEYTGQEIESLLLKSVRENKQVELPVAPVMFFEDVDCLIKNASMKSKFDSLLRQYQVDDNGEKRLILMTAIDFLAFQLDGYAIPVNPLHVNWRVIGRKAKEQGVQISIKGFWKLFRCKRISELEAELRRMKARNKEGTFF